MVDFCNVLIEIMVPPPYLFLRQKGQSSLLSCSSLEDELAGKVTIVSLPSRQVDSNTLQRLV